MWSKTYVLWCKLMNYWWNTPFYENNDDEVRKYTGGDYIIRNKTPNLM